MSHDDIPLSHINDCNRAPFSFAEFYARKRKWSLETFGPAQTTDGVVAHLRSEVRELYEAIHAGNTAGVREELADICLLAIDLSWRAGGSSDSFHGGTSRIAPRDAADYIGRHLDSTMPPAALAAVLWDIAFRALGCDGAPILEKFEELQTRTWPDWRTVPADQPIEHVREESWPDRIERVATESLSVDGQIAHLRAEVDGLRLLDEVNRIEMERVRDAIHALKDETTTAAAARVWSNLLAAESRARDALPTLGRSVDEDAVKAAQRIVRERDELAEQISALHEQLTKEKGTADDLTRRHNALYPESLAALGAKEGEAVIDAARRVAAERDALRAELDRRADSWAELDQMRAERDEAQERSGRIRLAYRSLRRRLVDMLGCPGDFAEKDILDLLADRINGPITDAEDDLLDQVQQLEGDLCTLKAALHVATRGRS